MGTYILRQNSQARGFPGGLYIDVSSQEVKPILRSDEEIELVRRRKEEEKEAGC